MYIAAYLAILAGCSAYACWFGGTPERVGVAILVAAVAASEIVSSSVHPTFRYVETGYLVIDAGALAAFCVLAAKAQRYWPIYLSSILLCQIVTHLLMLSPRVMPFSYSVMLAIWSFLKPPLLAVAAWRHVQRVSANGSDPNWSSRP